MASCLGPYEQISPSSQLCSPESKLSHRMNFFKCGHCSLVKPSLASHLYLEWSPTSQPALKTRRLLARLTALHSACLLGILDNKYLGFPRLWNTPTHVLTQSFRRCRDALAPVLSWLVSSLPVRRNFNVIPSEKRWPSPPLPPSWS